MRYVAVLVIVGLFAGSHSAFGCWIRADEHCGNLEGDATCEERGIGMYCSVCVMVADGCTNEMPSDECRVDGSVIETTFHTTGSGSGLSSSSVSSSSGGLQVDDTGLFSDGGPTSSFSSEGSEVAGEGLTETGMSGEECEIATYSQYSECVWDTDCSEPDTMCYNYFINNEGFCTQVCSVNADCPCPSSGEALPICIYNPIRFVNQCVLECGNGSGGPSCPNGMDCEMVLGLDGEPRWRCGWLR